MLLKNAILNTLTISILFSLCCRQSTNNTLLEAFTRIMINRQECSIRGEAGGKEKHECNSPSLADTSSMWKIFIIIRRSIKCHCYLHGHFFSWILHCFVRINWLWLLCWCNLSWLFCAIRKKNVFSSVPSRDSEADTKKRRRERTREKRRVFRGIVI